MRRPLPGHARATLSLLSLFFAGLCWAGPTSPPSAPAVQYTPLVVTPVPNLGPSILVNGDFENRTQPAGCYSNLSNADVTAHLPGITAFGNAEEIDIYADGTDCFFGGVPQSGTSKLAIHIQVLGLVDAFSFSLTTPVVAGTSYDFSCYAWPNTTFDPNIGSLEIGLSNNPAVFGTPVWSGTPATVGMWNHLTQTFIAPINANYLTVRSGAPNQSWLHIDNFALSPTGVVSVPSTSWGRVKAIYR